MPVASIEAFGFLAAPAPRWRGQTPTDDYGFDEAWASEGYSQFLGADLPARQSFVDRAVEWRMAQVLAQKEKALQQAAYIAQLDPWTAKTQAEQRIRLADLQIKALLERQAAEQARPQRFQRGIQQFAASATDIALVRLQLDKEVAEVQIRLADKERAELESRWYWKEKWFQEGARTWGFLRPFNVGDKFFEVMFKVLARTGKPFSWFTQPAYDAPDGAYGQWVYIMKLAYGPAAIPRPTDPKMLPVYEGSLARKRPMGTWAEVAKVITAPVRFVARNATLILSIVGAALAPFTGGASLAASSLILAANKARIAANAASAAKRMAAADAAQQQEGADKAAAETRAMVDTFYRDQNAWFLQHDITQEKWDKLTLDEKIGLIEAGAKGTLPTAVAPILEPGAAPVVAVAPVAAPGAPGVPAYVPPPPTGYVPPPPTGYVPSYEPQPSAPAPSYTAASPGATAGVFELLIEGQKAGTFDVLEDAAKEALKHTAPGDRFEVIANGRSTGLRIRTSSGSMEVPRDIEMKVRSMPWSDMAEYVASAEKGAKESGGGFPWWLLLAAGGAAKVAGVI